MQTPNVETDQCVCAVDSHKAHKQPSRQNKTALYVSAKYGYAQVCAFHIDISTKRFLSPDSLNFMLAVWGGGGFSTFASVEPLFIFQMCLLGQNQVSENRIFSYVFVPKPK